MLLADDSRSMRTLIRSAFPYGADYPEFYEVSDGKEAVTAYRARRYDIVLLDIKMPVLDGIEAVQAIHSYDEDVFAVLISGDVTPDIRLRATQAGAMFLVNKPVNQMVGNQIVRAYRTRVRRPVSMLIADESPFVMAVLKQGLDILTVPHRMARVHDAKAALKAVQTQYFDLVFIDNHLGGEDGLKLVSYIKGARPSTYVVMFTDDSTKAGVMRAREHGADDYLLKSVDLTQLKKVWMRFMASAKDEFGGQRPLLADQ